MDRAITVEERIKRAKEIYHTISNLYDNIFYILYHTK